MRSSTSRLARLDLNLLVILRELLREQNVTRAASRVGVSQPAASAALARLRKHFGDELLVRSQGRYELSALAHQLVDQVEQVCEGIETLLAAGAEFDPATSHREFTVVMSDYVIAVLGEPLVAAIPSVVPVSGQLAALGVRPAVGVRVDSFQAVPYLVASTDRIALVQQRLARIHAPRMGLRVLEPPIPLDPLVERLWWHERHAEDPAHTWFRRVLVSAARSLPA